MLPVFNKGEKRVVRKGTEEEKDRIQLLLNDRIEKLEHPRNLKLGLTSQGIWDPDKKLVQVTKVCNSFWDHIGHTINKITYIYPEEALFLIESSLLYVMIDDLPVSINQAYSTFLNSDGFMTTEKYRVYSKLAREGYKIFRFNSHAFHNAENICECSQNDNSEEVDHKPFLFCKCNFNGKKLQEMKEVHCNMKPNKRKIVSELSNQISNKIMKSNYQNGLDDKISPAKFNNESLLDTVTFPDEHLIPPTIRPSKNEDVVLNVSDPSCLISEEEFIETDFTNDFRKWNFESTSEFGSPAVKCGSIIQLPSYKKEDLVKLFIKVNKINLESWSALKEKFDHELDDLLKDDVEESYDQQYEMIKCKSPENDADKCILARNVLTPDFIVFSIDIKRFQKRYPPKPEFYVKCLSMMEEGNVPSNETLSSFSSEDGVQRLFAFVGVDAITFLETNVHITHPNSNR